MGQSVWRRPVWASLGICGAAAAFGCTGPVADSTPATPVQAPIEVRRPASPTSRVNTPAEQVDAGRPEVSSDTERDAKFARFIQEHSAGMIKKAAVGIEKKGELKIEISRDIEPDDTLPLTKSLMAGARKDFPDRPITLSLYDPQGDPILKARYRVGEGVHYQIAHGDAKSGTQGNAPTAPKTNPLERGGVTEKDQAFAQWAEGHGRGMLRYVEADLERHGRLWFGVSRDVKPAEVRPLTKSLLEGARKEFPKADLVATVFDPEGERIGKARLGRDDEVHWED
jgi:hypothetical protein